MDEENSSLHYTATCDASGAVSVVFSTASDCSPVEHGFDTKFCSAVGDSLDAEGIYGATAFTRMCLAEAMAEKVQRGELRLEHAHKIGRQIMRENALELYPKLRRFLWRDGEEKRG